MPPRRLPTTSASTPSASRSRPTGRGTSLNPTSRFERLDVVSDKPDGPGPRTKYYRDRARSVLVSNDSPDVGLDVGLNPYRGCEHGCVYCFARPNHEYLGFSAGLDFETKIVVKENAADLLSGELRRRSWRPRPIMLSGTTDPYQPAERRLRVTRACLEVLAQARQPVGIITKNRGVTRDLDLLGVLAAHRAVAVTISVTTLRRDLQQRMEPRTSSPRARLDTIRALREAGIPVGVNLAPVVPGLTDDEMPAILAAAREAGATWAGYILLRLPHGVKELFTDWLRRWYPNREKRVIARLREAHGGRLYDGSFGVRGKGGGVYATQLKALFRTSARKLGYEAPPELDVSAFRPPPPPGQLTLL